MYAAGRPVDVIIRGTAPHEPIISGRYRHTVFTSVVSVLDYTSVVIPVTHVDMSVGNWLVPTEFLSEADRRIDSAPVGIQLVGQQLQEDRILVLAK
ncbi:hypothetical protein BDV23DRAFT_161224 [Aspergillus alliaceus]|uniref:Amidase domain-containing protein n=1 Tax=Petromyces alliaceus TaxID=209559 RepID=A0A5N7C0R4_PETAA|nr:hypothetical protein BDV23DRAFT_161224 [Aspergillus alliaceus]